MVRATRLTCEETVYPGWRAQRGQATDCRRRL